MMKQAISKAVPVLFLVCMIAISGIPAFVSASDASGPAIYFDKSIGLGSQLVVSGVGFSPSATLTFMWGDQVVQTFPNPLVTDSSGAFTGILLMGKLNQDGINALTVTDGKMTVQSPLAINPHEHNENPRHCFPDGRNSADGSFCGCYSGASNIAPFVACCEAAYDLDFSCV